MKLWRVENRDKRTQHTVSGYPEAYVIAPDSETAVEDTLEFEGFEIHNELKAIEIDLTDPANWKCFAVKR